MKKILIISRNFFPIISPRSFRSTELAKEFSRQGHHVTILTKYFDLEHEIISKKYNFEIIYYGRIGNYKNNYSKKKISKIFWGYSKLVEILFYYPYIIDSFQIFNKLKIISKSDLIISIAFPHSVHWGVALSKKFNRDFCGIWIADCGDPFMGNKESKYKHPFYFKFVENWFCKLPDFISIPILESASSYPDVCREKIRIIPQGFDFNEGKFKPKEIKNPFPIFAYAGLVSKGVRDPSKFLEYLCSKDDINFTFIMYTSNIDFLQPYIQKLGKKLVIHDYIPRDQLLLVLNDMDFLVNFENQNFVQSPSKLIDYALVGKPILSVKSKELDSILIDEFLSRNYENRFIVQGIEKYDIRNVCWKFLKLAQ
jgi:hypothetical protein